MIHRIEGLAGFYMTPKGSYVYSKKRTKHRTTPTGLRALSAQGRGEHMLGRQIVSK